MTRNLKGFVFLGFFLFALFSCSSDGSNNVNRAFYYWKTKHITDYEAQMFRECNAQKLYIKIFEVAVDEVLGVQPVSKANIHLSSQMLKESKIVPCIFIENDAIASSTNEQLDELAENTVFLTNRYIDFKLKDNESDTLDCSEIQIDCDWMASSRDQYFYFLKALRNHTDKEISCTLRLYPYKFRTEMGVPPVNRVMLLCYNLLNPRAEENKNSILDLVELEKYIHTDSDYPLPVDVTLPCYSSCYVFNNAQFQEVHHGVPQGLEGICLPSEDGLWYVVKQDTSVEHNYYRQGQRLRIERVGRSLLLEATNLVLENIELQKGATVGLYHLDENEIKQYNDETLDSVYMLFDQR
jgi:hypothetical protein